MLEMWRTERAAKPMFGKDSEWRKMDSRTAATVAACDPEFASVDAKKGRSESPIRVDRQMEKQAAEVDKLMKDIEKKKKIVQKHTRAKRTGEAQRAQAEVDSLERALVSRRREMARRR